jgi:hypothetical protein
MEGAAKPPPGRNFPINRPQFLGEIRFMQNIPGNAEHTASPTRDSVGNSRGHHYARFPKVKRMARCTVLFMGLSLIAGCASSPRESLMETAQRALPSSLGRPELVEDVEWYILDGVPRTSRGPCRNAIAIFSDRFILLRTPRSFVHIQGMRSYDTLSNSRWECSAGFVPVSEWHLTIYSRQQNIFLFKDVRSISTEVKPGALGINTLLEIRVPFGPALPQPGRAPTPKILVIEVSPDSQLPRILDQRRGQ